MSPFQGFSVWDLVTTGLHPWLQPATPFGVKVSATPLRTELEEKCTCLRGELGTLVAAMPRTVLKELSFLGDANLSPSLSDTLGFDFGELCVAGRFSFGLFKRCFGIAQNNVA